MEVISEGKKYKCRYCNDIGNEKTDNFYPNNKSVCKKCISIKKKVKSRTVRPADEDARIFCRQAGEDFDKISRESEMKRIQGRGTKTINEINPDTNEDICKYVKDLIKEIKGLKGVIEEMSDRLEKLESTKLKK